MAIDLISTCIALGDHRGNGTERERSKRLACGNPGAIGSRCEAGLLRGTSTDGAEECRLIRRPSVSSQTKGFRLGRNCWSRGQKVRLLLGSAAVECRPSLAPPISMHSLSSAHAHKAISCRAHCLLGRIGRLWVRRADCWLCFISVQRKDVSL